MKRTRIWPWFVLALGVILLALRLFVIEPYKMPSSSMLPTLRVGGFFFANKLARTPARGDVIVFQYPKDPSKDYVKRVIAIGGDRVAIRGDRVILNGKPVAQTLVAGPCGWEDVDESDGRTVHHDCTAVTEQLDGKRWSVYFDKNEAARDTAETTVPAGSYWVLGDNRGNSHDSRHWGAVPAANVRGTLWYRGAEK
jgi:signal peptidase I